MSAVTETSILHQEEVHGAFLQAQSLFQEGLAAHVGNTEHDSASEIDPDLLHARTQLVIATQGVLDAAHFVEVTGDFHYQEFEAINRGLPANFGYSADGLREYSSMFWVGPYNRQTGGYAELSGGIHRLKNLGLIPVLAYENDRMGRPSYPLVADMSTVGLKPIDALAKESPLTNRFGLSGEELHGYTDFELLEGMPVAEFYNLIAPTIQRLIDEGSIPERDITVTNAGKSVILDKLRDYDWAVHFNTGNSVESIERCVNPQNPRVYTFYPTADGNVTVHFPWYDAERMARGDTTPNYENADVFSSDTVHGGQLGYATLSFLSTVEWLSMTTPHSQFDARYTRFNSGKAGWPFIV